MNYLPACHVETSLPAHYVNINIIAMPQRETVYWFKYQGYEIPSASLADGLLVLNRSFRDWMDVGVAHDGRRVFLAQERDSNLIEQISIEVR
jgi:hypothetical protein